MRECFAPTACTVPYRLLHDDGGAGIILEAFARKHSKSRRVYARMLRPYSLRDSISPLAGWRLGGYHLRSVFQGGELLADFDYPLLLEPISVPKVWGGGRLARIPGRKVVESADPIGESWDVSTWPTAPDNKNLCTVTKITNGPLAGTLLDQVVNVPVVVKVIDSADKLSVQNHPVLPDVHKDEMWYILEAEKGAYLFLGLADGVTKQQFCDLICSSDPPEEAVLAALHRREPLGPGSHFNVPTGTVHAIGPGLLTFEISEQTQVTYRLYDYNRERSRGKLDLEEGCRAILTPRPDLPTLDPGLTIDGADGVDVITEFPSFCVVRASGELLTVRSAEHMHLVTATKGECKLSGPTDEWSVQLGYSFSCLVPATASPYIIDTRGSGEVLISPLKS
jgi:mannose-6-phosphate isomerase